MKYKKIEERGRGGFGVVDVVKGEDGRVYARKTLVATPPVGISYDELRARFSREVKYQSTLNHPNVVAILKSQLDDNPPWFIMDLADRSLADELRIDATLGGAPEVALFDILAGLEEIHARGFKHRDLKPGNVLRYTEENGKARYAISDFGLMTPSDGETSTLTASNMEGGTLRYRAPECAINFKRATIQSDIYSFGAILHDIFGGGQNCIPHTELSAAGPVGPIIAKCTKRNIRRRYQNVSILRDELFQILSTEEIVYSSKEEQEIVNLLAATEELSDDDWDRIFDLIDANDSAGKSNHAIFRAISQRHLMLLEERSPDVFGALGADYADYAQRGSFNFDYCDVIAGKLQIFFDLGPLDLKAKIAVATLVLGTGHNRWFVERRFVRMASSKIQDVLAERIIVEAEVQGISFDRLVGQLERSINISRDELHPILRGSSE